MTIYITDIDLLASLANLGTRSAFQGWGGNTEKPWNTVFCPPEKSLRDFY